MITQFLKTSLLMKQEEMLILRENDKGNEIQFIFTDLTGITAAEFRLIKPDETFVISNGVIADNTITFTVTEQMCAIPGKARFNIRLYSNDTNIYTYVSRCLIDINLDLEDAIESIAEVNGYTFPDDFALKSEIPSTDNFATKEYVDDAVASIPEYTPISYSLTEQDTGLKWIDGKPIYQKTFVISDNNYVDMSGLNIDTFVAITGLCSVDNGTAIIPLYDNVTSQYRCYLDIDRGNMRMRFNTYGWTLDRGHITLQYTKTTDTV